MDKHLADSGFPDLDFCRDALLLDIDGTIIDIAPAPEAVLVPESLKRNLAHVRDKLGGALALLSGRTISAVDELFAPLSFAAAGCHGAEVRFAPHSQVHRRARPLGPALEAELSELAKLDPRIRLEDKHFTFAIHYRQVPALEDRIFELVNAKLQDTAGAFELMRGKAVIEIKSAGFDKGTGLRDLMERMPFSGRKPIFFGDDRTDEDAFARVPEFGGIGISVGRLLPGASASVGSAQVVREWLACLAAEASNE